MSKAVIAANRISKKLPAAISLLFFFPLCVPAQSPPATPIRPVTDVYFGIKIVDPYRWLENLRDPEVQDWLKAQNEYTNSQLKKLPWRERILNRIRQLDRQSRSIKNVSTDDRGRYYFIREDADGKARVYVRDPKTATEKVSLDPAKFNNDEVRSATLTNFSPSPDGRYIAFVMRDSGGPKLYVSETSSGRIVGIPVSGILGFTGLDWDPDSNSIYIVKLPPAGPDSKASESFLRSASYRHIVGANPETDLPVVVQGPNRGFELKETSWPFVFPLPDRKLLAVWVEDGSRSGHALYVAMRSDVLSGNGIWRKVADFDDGAKNAVFHKDFAYLIEPRKSDGKSRIVRLDVRNGDARSAVEIPVPGKGVISDVGAAADALYVTTSEGTSSRLYRLPYAGAATPLVPPVSGTTEAILLTPSRPGGLFRISSWTEPAAIVEYLPTRGWKRSSVQGAGVIKTPDLVSEDVFVKSHDGVEVPLTIIHKRQLQRDSANPTYLIGYGSYGYAINPGFDNAFTPWLEAGGILAYAHTRGGGELGEAWHLAGSKDKKQNTWLDFIACAQFLIDQKYTSPEKLAGGGTSAGGILIGRAITERPDLFRTALISVGTTDMLRAEYQMNGPANVVEFGTTKDKTGFEQLFAMSAYHHVTSGKRYPAVLLTAGMRDPNVDIWQPAKMTAILQSRADADRPVLLRVDPDAGHDQYGSTREQIQSWRADQLAFLMWQLGVAN